MCVKLAGFLSCYRQSAMRPLCYSLCHRQNFSCLSLQQNDKVCEREAHYKIRINNPFSSFGPTSGPIMETKYDDGYEVGSHGTSGGHLERYSAS